MSFLHFMLSAVLTSIVAARITIPKDAQEACKQFDYQTLCYKYCIYQFYGLLDQMGRYVEDNAVDMIAKFSEVSLSWEQVKRVAETCNYLNSEEQLPGCNRAEQVLRCINEERYKIISEWLAEPN